MNRKTLALVLSGGGARGLAHLGVVQVLQEAGVPVDVVVGTSMGGLVGAAFAAGMSFEGMVAVAHEFARRHNFLGFADPPGRWALFRGQRLVRWLTAQIGAQTFAELARPLVVVAADLNTGEEVHLSEGPLAPALQATMAIPGLLDPVPYGERLLVDGGVLNVLPTDVARAWGAERIVAVYTSPPERMEAWRTLLTVPLFPKGLRRWVVNVARSADLLIARQVTLQLQVAPADVLIRPTLPAGITMLTGFEQVEALVEAGRQAAQAALPQIRALLAT